MKRAHKAGDGLLAAAHTLPVEVPRVLGEFRKLNTRESRAAFADHWIGIWALDFDKTWQVIYELLKIVEDDQLYKDPRRVGPKAPGFPRDTHSQESSYPDFAAYFTERVKQPLDRWAELEKTYKYAQRYAPEIFELPLSEAAPLAKHGGDHTSLKFQEAQDLLLHGGDRKSEQAGNASLLRQVGRENTAAYIRARLKRDGKTELLAQVERGEISAHAAAKEAGYRKQAICHLPTVPGFLKAAQAHLSPEQRLELKEAL